MILDVPPQCKNMECCLIAVCKVVVEELRCKQVDCNLSCLLFLNNFVLQLHVNEFADSYSRFVSSSKDLRTS